VVAQATVEFDGSDALLGFSGSAWSQQPGPISLQVWLDGEPLGTALSIQATSGQMHMCLGRSWLHVPGVAAGTHKIMVVAGMSTITDQNDRVSLTLWQLGDGLAVRSAADSPCPPGNGQVLLTERPVLEGGPWIRSGSGSGYVAQVGQLVQTTMLTARGDGLIAEVYANNSNQHLATVPVDSTYVSSPRGPLQVQMVAQPGTSTDQTDYAHLAVVEWVDTSAAPAVLDLNPYLMDSPAHAQQGGGYIAQTSFQSSGGTVVLRISLSAWTPEPATMIGASIEIDGNIVGHIELFANPSSTHLTLVSNDLVVPGLAAGYHTLYLQSGASTYTDQNDRVCVMAMELPATATQAGEYS
jgi:hypothetical protein